MRRLEELRVGERVGRYRLVRQLGRGAMGVVFLADDTLLKQQLCVKVLDPLLATNDEAIERFHREIVLARRIVHKGVCRLHDIHHEDGLYFITMEYVDGVPLKDRTTRGRPLMSVDRTLSIGVKLCEALAAAHDVNVIHRDLKPANIMVTDDDEISILDFGIATADDMRSSLTLPGYAIGTRHYISPEVWAGKPATARSDQFAIGVILYNLLTHQMPFHAARDLLLLECMKAGPPPPPSSMRAEVSAALDAVVLRALALAPEQRFPDVRALGDALMDVLADTPRAPAPAEVTVAVLPTAFPAQAELTMTPAPMRVSEADADVTALLTVAVAGPVPFVQRRLVWAAAAIVATGAVVGATLAWPGPADEPPVVPVASEPVAPSFEPAVPPPALAPVIDVELDDLRASAEADVARDAGTIVRSDDEGDEPDSSDVTPRARPVNDRQRWLDAKASLERMLTDRGILAGDDDQLDRLRARAANEARAKRYTEAAATEVEARRRAAAVVIDKAFVKEKLVRFNTRFDAMGNAAARSRVDAVTTDVLAAMRAGRPQDANRALNNAFAALSGKRP